MAPFARSAPGLAVNTVAEYIKGGIKAGRFTAGQRLVASELSAQLKVSLNVVREALSLLDGAGLVHVHPNRGAQIRSLSRDDVRQIFELREALEGQAAALAARNIRSPKDRKLLLDAFRKADKAARDGERSIYRTENNKFHEAILTLGGNPRLMAIASELTVPIYQLQMNMLLETNDLTAAAEGHRRIVDAILKGSPGRARDEMQEHVRTSGEVMIRLVDETA